MANAKASSNLEVLPTSPSLAQTLPSDAVLDALKMILLGAPLNEVLTTITRLIEAHSTGMLCSIFLLDEDSLHLRYGVTATRKLIGDARYGTPPEDLPLTRHWQPGSGAVLASLR